MRTPLLFATLLGCGALPSSAQAVQTAHQSATTPFDSAEAQRAVEKYSDLLEEMYVYPATGKAYAERLRAGIVGGTYAKFATAEQFADALERELAAVNPDLHLSVLPASVPTMGVISDTSYTGGTCPPAGQQLTRSIGKSGWLARDVAYVEFCGFQGGAANVADVQKFLEKHAGATTLIIDNRGNVGGAQQEMDLMFPHFYERLTELLRFEMRSEVADAESNPLQADPRMMRLPLGHTVQYAYFVEPKPALKTRLKDANIYVLTSSVTASAGEALVFALQQTGRATVVGEVTKGAGHLGPTLPIGGGYRAFIPIARIFNAETGKGWERTGVQPHIKVPAEAALDLVLRQAGASIPEAKRSWALLPTRQTQPE